MSPVNHRPISNGHGQPEVDRPTVLREAIVGHIYDQVSNHGSKAVSTTVQRMGKSSNTVWEAVEAAGEAEPHKRLDDWTDKRHAICTATNQSGPGTDVREARRGRLR